MLPAQPLTFKRGSDNLITVTMSPIVNVVGRTTKLLVKKRRGDADPPLASLDGTVVGDGTPGQYQYTLAETQTIALAAATYWYEVWRMDIGTRGVVAEGPFVDEATVRIPT